MHFRIQLIAILGSIVLTAAIFELVRKRRLREEYSLLWLLAGLCMLALSIYRPLVKQISDLMGVSYGPSALFFVAFMFGMLLAMHFSIIVSQLTEKVRILAQQNAILRLEISVLKSCNEDETRTDEVPFA